MLWVQQQRWTGDEPFRSWVHPVAMILALTVTHIGFGRARRAREPRARANIALAAYLASLVLVLVAIPRDAWPL